MSGVNRIRTTVESRAAGLEVRKQLFLNIRSCGFVGRGTVREKLFADIFALRCRIGIFATVEWWWTSSPMATSAVAAARRGTTISISGTRIVHVARGE